MEPASPTCLLNRPPVDWIVCFVPPREAQWWHRLIWSPLKHCFLLRCEGPNRWILFEPWWSRILMATLDDAQAGLFIEWAHEGVAVIVKEHVPGRSSQIRGWMSCAALIAHVLGRGYMVWTPQQLLDRLWAEPDVTLAWEYGIRWTTFC